MVRALRISEFQIVYVIVLSVPYPLFFLYQSAPVHGRDLLLDLNPFCPGLPFVLAREQRK